jgi:BlaI family penicillinase repressor
MLDELSRAERQIMTVLYRLGEATAADVARQLRDKPGYHTVRVTLANLERKGAVRHRREGQRYVFAPVVDHGRATKTEVKQLVRTFFQGSSSRAILALLDMSGEKLSATELAEIEASIEAKRREGRSR